MVISSHSDDSQISPELHLRRLPIADAIHRLEKYIDKAFLKKMTTVRIIHGKGTGEMRKAVWEILDGHELVKDFRLAYYGEGDAGVTIVYLEEYQWAGN